MTTRNIVELPEDLAVEIFSRVPAVSLVRLRSTSKSTSEALNALIKDERFAKKHSTNAPKQSLTIMLIASKVYLLSADFHRIHYDKVKLKPTSYFSLKDPLSKSSKEVNIRNIFHCDGLLLCTTNDNRLVVWNPCSSEIEWIQPRDSYKMFDTFALGKSSCNKYKILRMYHACYYNTNPVSHVYEVYDFTSSSWRVVRILETRDWFIPGRWDRGMSVNGDTYWLASPRDFSTGDFLLKFNFSTERFESVSLPVSHLAYDLISLSLTREDQRLCLLAYEDVQVQELDVWIAAKIESTGAVSWIKFLSVRLTHFLKRFSLEIGMNFLVDQENKLVVFCGNNEISNIFVYVMGEDKCVQVDHLKEKSRCSLVISYVPSLVQIESQNRTVSSFNSLSAKSNTQSQLKLKMGQSVWRPLQKPISQRSSPPAVKDDKNRAVKEQASPPAKDDKSKTVKEEASGKLQRSNTRSSGQEVKLTNAFGCLDSEIPC